MFKWLIHILGGIHEDEVLTKAVKRLYNTIGEDDILKEEGTSWIYRGKEMNEATKRLIISEAQVFLQGKLWEILQDDIRYRANLMMFEKSKTEQDLIAGKLWLYTLDSINTRLKSLEKSSGRFNSEVR